MELQLKNEVINAIESYHLPKYAEIPNVGLYLNQLARFINEYLEPFCDMAITESMISNYVKKHLVKSPVKKQYDRDLIAHLMFIALAKSVLSMDHIQELFQLQEEMYASETAYDYFCCEFENVLQYVFGRKDSMEEIGTEANDAKLMCRNLIITIAHKIYLDHCFKALEEMRSTEA